MSSWNFTIPLAESWRRVTDTDQANPQFINESDINVQYKSVCFCVDSFWFIDIAIRKIYASHWSKESDQTTGMMLK